MNYLEIISGFITLIGGGLFGGFFGWFFTRKKYNEEVQTVEISNTSELIQLYKTAMLDLKNEMMETEKRLLEALTELKQLRTDFDKLRNETK